MNGSPGRHAIERTRPADRRLVLLAILLLSGPLAPRCAPAPEPGARDQQPFTIGVIPGVQDFVTFVMDSAGIFERLELRPTTVRPLNPASLHLMIAERKVDIGFGGFTTMAEARAQGKDVIVVHGVFSPVNRVFVRPDSPLRSLSDLRGRKLGIFGGPASTTFTFLAVIARAWHGLDLFEDVELVTAPGPALAGLLDRGQIDAALLGTTESIRFAAAGTYRTLVDLSAEYRRHKGRAPAHVTITTNETFAAARPDTLRRFLEAYRAALAYVREHPDVWAAYARTIDLATDAEAAAFREQMAPNLVADWDAGQIAVQQEYLELVHETVGEHVLTVLPDGLIRDAFAP